MEQIELGKSGVRVSKLGIGTWAWGDHLMWGFGKGYGEDDLRQAFDETLRDGIDLFDTAEVYGLGRSEKFLGDFRGESVFGERARLATKFAPLPHRVTKGFFLRALRGSLKRLRVERVDLYQIHWNFAPVPVETLMDWMAEAFHLGLTRAVGVSNYDVKQVRRAHARLAQHGIPLASNQIRYNLLERGADFNGMTELCAELGVTIIAYSPLRYGVLSGKYDPAHPLPGTRGRMFSRDYLAQVQPLLHALKMIAEEYEKTMPQVAINWVIRRGAIAIPGAKNLKQARENAGAFGWVLASDDVEKLDEISARVHERT